MVVGRDGSDGREMERRFRRDEMRGGGRRIRTDEIGGRERRKAVRRRGWKGRDGGKSRVGKGWK